MLKRPQAPLLLALVATVLAACAAMGPTDGLTPVPVADFKTVAGNWAGPVSGISAQHDDWVEMIITPDGKYDFGSYRTIGVFGGTGTFTLSGGKLQMRGDRGSATYTLYQSGAKRVLRAEGLLADGRQVSATLSGKE